MLDMEPPSSGPRGSDSKSTRGQQAHKLVFSSDGNTELYYSFGAASKKGGSMHTYVESPATGRATLSIKHSYVRVLLNGVPVIASANWWILNGMFKQSRKGHKPNTSTIP